jgi:hypothetical protein
VNSIIFEVRKQIIMRKQVELSDVLNETLDKLDGNGILLVAGNPPNPMTIGWGTIGHIWSKQVINVMVRCIIVHLLLIM